MRKASPRAMTAASHGTWVNQDGHARPDGQKTDVIGAAADPKGLEEGAVQDGYGAVDVAGLLDFEKGGEEIVVVGGVFDIDDDDAAAGRVGGFNAFDDGVGSAGGGEVAGVSVLGGFDLPPGVMGERE